MIESAKQKFITGLKDNLKVEQNKINQKLKSVQKSDSLRRYNTKKTLSKKADKLLPVILMLSQLDKSFNKKENLKFVTDKNAEYLSESNSLKFYIRSDTKSNKFADKIKNYLAQNSFDVVNSKKDAVIIEVTTADNTNNGYISIVVKCKHSCL